jgi:metallo-beta-lactamase family protein
MRLSFHGAARDVTGSCHLLDVGGMKVLVDCGLFQGGREASALNRAEFGFDPAEIDVLLLTHAHLDHCGRIPLLVRRGFRGEIIATPATRDLARLVLLDAAHIQDEDAQRAARRARRRGEAPRPPLYEIEDVLEAFDRFGRRAELGRPLELGGGVRATFLEAGHILGSAFLLVEAEHRGRARRLVFSGDIGGPGGPILPDPDPAPACDHLIVETTYGDRPHRGRAESVAEMEAAIRAALARGGNVIIPTFAMERAQEILFHLREGEAAGRLPRGLPVFLDSPMAISATEIFRKHAGHLRPDVAEALGRGEAPFSPSRLHLTRLARDSMGLNRIDGGAVILAGAGMCVGGRVVHHLRHNLWRREAAVIFTGFAARGTPARRIIDGAGEIRIFGEPVKVNAQVHTINGFSAHAGRDELRAWMAGAGAPRMTWLVHGDPEGGMKAMAETLAAEDRPATTPALHDEVQVT